MNAIQNTLRAALVASLFAIAPLVAVAQETLTPTKLTGVEIVTVDQAKVLLGKAQFFDMRSAVNYGKGHLKGAIALPYDNKSENAENFDAGKDKFDMTKLPADKTASIVFYSDGPTGWKSYKAAATLTKLGYKNVKWMREGTGGWSEKSLPLE